LDDLITQLRKCGYGLYNNSLFAGCVLYAEDIVLMSGSCHGLQKLVNVCTAYGLEWDLNFNPSKSQVTVFGGPVPNSCQIFLDTSEISWCERVKYLGCYFNCRTADIDV